MAKAESFAVLHDIQTIFQVGTSTGLSDAQLLDRFRARSDLDSAETTFAGLIARHGRMVLGVCRRALQNPDDVADAFQATFLILVRKADTVRVEDSLGRWLYGVSRRVSVRARRAVARRSAREVQGIELAAAPAAEANHDELRDVLDQEVGRLPDKFRSAFVLCEFEGLAHDEAARQLGCAVGTIKSRLSRAREKLRSRLIRRGIAPAAWALVGESASASVPVKLIDATVSAAFAHAGGAISPAVTLLIQGVLRAMLLKKLSTMGVAVVATLTLATSAAVLARQATSARRGDQTNRQIVRGSVRVEGEPSDAPRSAAPVQQIPKEDEEDTADRIELLRLDVELLQAELQARKAEIYATSSTLNATHVPGQRDGEQAEKLRAVLDAARKEFIAKQKEFSRKRAELSAIDLRARLGANSPFGSEKAVDNRSARRKTAAPVQSAASPNPEISPVLEKRLSGIEQKLEEVLKALTALRDEIRR
jgi:RNA polymerase sigma factor (sigma-70 family)